MHQPTYHRVYHPFFSSKRFSQSNQTSTMRHIHGMTFRFMHCSCRGHKHGCQCPQPAILHLNNMIHMLEAVVSYIPCIIYAAWSSVSNKSLTRQTKNTFISIHRSQFSAGYKSVFCFFSCLGVRLVLGFVSREVKRWTRCFRCLLRSVAASLPLILPSVVISDVMVLTT